MGMSQLGPVKSRQRAGSNKTQPVTSSGNAARLSPKSTRLLIGRTPFGRLTSEAELHSKPYAEFPHGPPSYLPFQTKAGEPFPGNVAPVDPYDGSQSVRAHIPMRVAHGSSSPLAGPVHTVADSRSRVAS